jgi:hypothetical protein
LIQVASPAKSISSGIIYIIMIVHVRFNYFLILSVILARAIFKRWDMNSEKKKTLGMA